MLAGAVTIESISVYLASGIDPKDISSLRDSAVPGCSVDVAVRTGEESGGFSSICALQNVDGASLTSRSDFEHVAGGSGVGNAVEIAVHSLDHAAGISAI